MYVLVLHTSTYISVALQPLLITSKAQLGSLQSSMEFILTIHSNKMHFTCSNSVIYNERKSNYLDYPTSDKI